MKNYFICFLIILLFNIQPANAKSSSEKTGDILQIVIPTISLATTYFKKDKVGTHEFYRSFLTNFGITYGLKVSINRKRPNGGNYSFPSGHTSASFMGAAFINKRYGLKYAIPAYLAAIYVGWSRVHNKRHYTSDVIGGALVGILSSNHFTTPYREISIKPVVTKNMHGLILCRSW
jgi:membrane-associated phospholipid phosphatase